MLVVVNCDYTITVVNIGWPGSAHNACVFVHSGLYQKAAAGATIFNRGCCLSIENLVD